MNPKVSDKTDVGEEYIEGWLEEDSDSLTQPGCRAVVVVQHTPVIEKHDLCRLATPPLLPETHVLACLLGGHLGRSRRMPPAYSNLPYSARIYPHTPPLPTPTHSTWGLSYKFGTFSFAGYCVLECHPNLYQHISAFRRPRVRTVSLTTWLLSCT